MVQHDSRRLSVGVVPLAVALTLAGAAHAQLPYGTDGATVGGWNFVDFNGTHTGQQFSCDFVVSGATGWCGPGVRQFDATFARASLDQHLGTISASASVSNPAGSGYRLFGFVEPFLKIPDALQHVPAGLKRHGRPPAV